MFEPIIINLDYSPREERHSEQTKSIGSRIGKRIGSGLVDRPNIGKNRRTIGSGRIDIPTGGARGYKKPTGSRLDIDRDGWADEGTTNPVWVGLSSGQNRSRPVIETQRARPKINLINQKINERKKIRQKIKYGENSLDGKLVSRKNGSKWLDGLSNEQISNILVPDSYQTYSEMLADGFGVDKGTIEKYLESRWGVGKPWLEIDYSEKSTKELRQALQSTLDESPIFSWAVRNYGSPTYAVMTRKSAETYNNRDAVKPLYDALKKIYPDAPGEPQFAASNHLDFEMVTFNPVNVIDKKSWQTSEPISTSFQTSKLPSDSDTVIDRSISGTILHEWAHWYHSEMLLANIESTESKKRSPKSLINPQDSDFTEKIQIALEYNSDNGNMNLHLTKKPLEDSPNEPRTITSYGHVSKKEMFAEGMLAYMHPNEQLKLKAINKKLRQDIETILVGDKGIDAWKDSKANIKREKNILSSGRKNRKLTKLSSGSKTEKTEKPKYPRHPSYGPFLDGADDVFTNVKNWEEFKEVYNNLEINFFDYETTGLVSDEFQQSSGNGAPVQFGVTKTKGGKEIGRLNIFMNPGEELGDWSRKNLKDKDGKPLTDEWLSSQISIAEAHKKLIEFVGPDAIFGVQNAVFDKTVLEDALNSSDIEWRPKGWVDTKVVSDLVIPKWTKENQDAPWTIDKETGEKIPSNSLKALTEYLDINLGKKHHTADADAAATSELMSKIIDKAIEKNWSNDIFDKNWRDQKIKNKLENHQQKIIDFEQQKNNWISETSPKKSTVPKETEEKKFGFGKLSSGTTSYKGRHESPDASNGAPLYNLANGAIYPEDIYGPNGANLYGGAFPDLAQKAVAIFRKLRNKPDSELTVYRAVPRGKKIKEGDWVTILPEYAKIHGDSWLKNDYEIATKKVKAKELFNEGNSLLEFGYHSKLSSGKYDGAPTYKGKVWKDRKNELDAPVWPFPSQSKQYPKDGPPGISYFKGVVNESTWVDCLLYRDNSGKLIGILNHYPFALVDPDDPRIVERRGNFNIFIDPKHKGKGIGTKLVDEAVSRYNVDLRRQRYSEEGADFINNYIRKLPENKNKPKLSSGATEITPVERKEIADKQLSVKLSALDIEAIGNWNGYLFKDINDYLRNNNSGNQELAEGVVSAFERISVPVPADLVLWRGIRASQGEARAYRVGDTLQDDGFQSATFKKRIATQFNSPRSINDEWEAVVFEINAKKGTKVVDIQSLVEKLDLASDAEDEILLQNGTQYKVAKIERNINQNEWAGIDDTSFKGEKITVITVDVIKNSDKDSRLSSGSTPASKMAEQRIQRRIAAYKERAEKGDGSELRLPWDENGKLKETPIIVSEEDDDFDDDEEFSKEEKENRAAVLEYSKISPEEMEERIRRAEESKRRLNSPEYLEQSRLRRVARNKGKETNTHNADGTLKEKKGEKLSSGSLINSEKYRKKHTALLKKILTRMDKEGAGWTDEDMRLARLDELEYNFGKSLRQTIEYWYGGAFDVTYNMRDEIESGKISKEVNELLSIIDISPVTSRPIWRGMRYMTQDELDEIINRGVTLPLGAFSGQKSTAISYADGGYSNNSQVSVILRLERGVKAFPMKHFSPIDEEEYLVAGTFEVVSVSQTRVGRFGETVTEVELRSLSSGGQPRMNLSDEEKREIIAIASQRTDDFSKSVVAQFRRNGKLSDRQWNALNKATLRRSRLSSGKTNRANRRANSSKLSSGSQPRMNLSDEEKREIIAIASQRTDDFSKSVVAQFRRNGRLSDKQWNALNRATLRRSRLSSGAIGVEEFKNMSDAKHAQILSEAGLSQRGEAENAGQAVWEKGFTGLYQYALEHIGDLYHRAQHRLQYSQYGLDEVDEKIAKILGYLRQPYGFEREVEEQTNGVTAKKPELTIDVLKSLGKKYADAHGKLPVYNLPAELMVKASMHLGNWEFEDAARTLEQLREMLNDEEKWKFMLSRQGTIEYLESKRETRSPFSKSPVSDDAIKLTKAEQKILKEIKESGTPDFAKVVHAVALDYDEPGSILDNMKPTNMRVTMKNARTVSSEIQRQAQESLERAGFPEEFSVWRTAGAGGRPNTGVVSVTTRKGGLGLFKGTVVEYRVSRSDVLTHGEGFLGNLQTYAEDELHVDIEKLRPVGSKLSSGKTNRTNRRADNSRLSSGKSSVLNDEEKKQISDILKKEFPGGISSAVGKMADYSGSRLQNNRDGQVSLNPQEKKAIEALENIGKIIDKRISESVSEKRDAGSLGESPEMQLLLEKEKAIDAANIYLRKIYRSTEDALDKIKKLDKQVRKSIVSNIYKIPKKTSNIDKEYSEHNNKISGSYLVQLLKDVRQNLTAGEYRAAENFTLPVRKIVDSSGREIMPRKIINFNYSNTYKNANNLHLTDLVSEIDMEFLELPENQPIINDITLTLNLADKISKNLIKKTEKEARKISELSDAEILDFIEKEIYVNVESFGSKTGSMKYRRNILTGRAFTMGPEVVSKELPEFDSESSLRALNEKSAKDLLIKTLREIFTDNEVIQTSDKSFKARQNTTIELDEKLAKGIAPQYVAPSSLSVEEAIRFYGDKAGLISKETRELNKQRESYVEQGLVPKMQYGVENEFEKQTAKLKRELFVQALGELGIAFTKPENVRKTVVRLYMQRLNDFYQWTKGLGLKEGEDGKNRPDETIDFNKNNPYEYVGGEKDGRHAATIPLMNKVLSLIPENLTNGSLVVELPAEEAERLTRLGASETFGYLGKHKIISKYFADAWVNPLERGGSKLSIIWRLVPGKNRAHAHNILNGKVLITQEPAPTSGPTDEWESVALHEIVHGVEYANPVVTALEWMYWVSRRKAGEALTTLRRKDGTEYRNKNEKGVVDEWGESYAGKIYEGRPFDALEIFTTGMQSIFYENTSKNADPSHRAFTIGVLVAAGNGKPQ